jgi:hypothetical protein
MVDDVFKDDGAGLEPRDGVGNVGPEVSFILCPLS